MLSIICHFIDLGFKAYAILLNLKALYSPYSSDNIATLVTVLALYVMWSRALARLA